MGGHCEESCLGYTIRQITSMAQTPESVVVLHSAFHGKHEIFLIVLIAGLVAYMNVS